MGPTSRVKAVLRNKQDQDHEGCSAALLHLAVCHSIIIDMRTNQFNSSSPDELALVQGAKDLGFEFINRDAAKIITVKANGVMLKFELLQVLEFTSQRKRMSVVVRDLQTNKILLLSKGADSIIEALLDESQSQNLQTIMNFVSEFANEGLRTLLLA